MIISKKGSSAGFSCSLLGSVEVGDELFGEIVITINETTMDTYSEAHLFIAAIRILSHQKGLPPSVEDVCTLIGISDEAGHSICRNLQKRKIIETLADPYSIKLSVADHLELEKIPRQEDQHSNLGRELEKFLQEKRKKEKSAAAIQTELDKKKRDMLADIEAKFKKEMEKFKKA